LSDEATSGFDVAGATAAIEAGGGLGNLMAEESGHVSTPVAPAREQQSTTPEVQQNVESATPPHWSQQQRDEFGRWQRQQAEQAAREQEQDTFTKVDPSTLAPEMQEIYKSLQADYTRKTQTLAEQRRQYEQFGDPETLQQATQLWTTLQDPNNWPAIHQELTQNLRDMGYSLPEAQAEASRQIQEATPSVQPGDPLASWNEDPELKPVADYIKSLEQKVSGFEAQWQQRQAQEQQERLQTALVGELQRQENIIRQNNPHYADTDVDAIYELSSYYGGNLLQAQQRYEALWADRLDRYMNEKGTAADMGGHTVPGVSTPVQTITPEIPAKNFDQAHENMMEALRQMEAL